MTMKMKLLCAATCFGVVASVFVGGLMIDRALRHRNAEPINTDEDVAASEPDPKPWIRGHTHVQVATAEDFTEVDTLLVTVLVECTDPGRKVAFRSWGRSATATDSRGKACPLRPANLSMHKAISFIKDSLSAKWGYGTGSVTSDRPRFEMITFSRPAPAATYLDVSLNAKQVGESGTIRFRIPREMWAAN